MYFRKRKYKITNSDYGQIYAANCLKNVRDLALLRWGIEVYFKEAKQHLGFLSEQSRHYSAYIASIHLTGLRYCLLLHAKKHDEIDKVSGSRSLFSDSLRNLDFACKLWGLFKALISDAISSITSLSASEGELILDKINEEVTSFFNQVMQMDTFTLRQEAISSGKYP